MPLVPVIYIGNTAYLSKLSIREWLGWEGTPPCILTKSSSRRFVMVLIGIWQQIDVKKCINNICCVLNKLIVVTQVRPRLPTQTPWRQYFPTLFLQMLLQQVTEVCFGREWRRRSQIMCQSQTGLAEIGTEVRECLQLIPTLGNA